MRPVDHQSDFFRIIEFFNKVAGVWLEPKTSGAAKRWLYVIWDTFLVVCATSFIISEVLVIETIMGNPLVLVPHIAMLFNTFVALFEFVTLMYNQPKIAKLRKVLQSESFNYEELGDIKNVVEDAKTFYSRITITTYLVYWMVAVGGHLSALENLNAESLSGRYGVNTTCLDLIPHPFAIPFQTNTTRRCKNALMVMDFGLIISAGYIATHDTVLYSFLSCIKVKFEAIGEATITIRERTAVKVHMAEDFEILNDEEFPEFEELMYCEIKRCNVNLAILLSACKDLEDIFCYTLLVRTVSSLLGIAADIYFGSFLSLHDPEIYHQAEFLITGIFQLFMICYFGVFITDSGAAYNTCLYEINWYSCSSRFKRAMLIMMNQMQRPLYLTIGKFFPLSLQTFVQVSKAAFSYATVLKTI